MRAGTYPARGYATLELSRLELSFAGAYAPSLSDVTSNSPGALNLPAPDRPQLLYLPLRGLQEPVFLINSRPDLFCVSYTVKYRTAFSRSYGSNLPSSLTENNPSTLVYSTNPPVSVYGTIIIKPPFRGFSSNLKLCQLASPVGKAFASWLVFIPYQ